MVQFVTDDMESKNHDDSILIINASTKERDEVEDNLRAGIIEKYTIYLYF